MLKEHLRTGWRTWKAFSERVANVQARVLLSVFYATFMAPFGFWQAFVEDRLGLKRPADGPAWVERRTADRGLDDGLRQY